MKYKQIRLSIIFVGGFNKVTKDWKQQLKQ